MVASGGLHWVSGIGNMNECAVKEPGRGFPANAQPWALTIRVNVMEHFNCHNKQKKGIYRRVNEQKNMGI